MSELIQFPTRPGRLTSPEGCPAWCAIPDTDPDHTHASQPQLFVDRDRDGEPEFAISARSVQLAPGLPCLVDIRAWQAGPDVFPGEVEELLTPTQARNLARILLEAADQAEGAVS